MSHSMDIEIYRALTSLGASHEQAKDLAASIHVELDRHFDRHKSEAAAERELQDRTWATKQDLADLTVATKQDIADLATATKRDIADLATATKRDMVDLAAATKRDIADLAAANKRDIDALAATNKKGLAELAASTKADIAALAAATKTDIGDLRREIAEVRNITTQGHAELLVCMNGVEQRLSGLHRWTLAVVLGTAGLMASVTRLWH